MKANYKNEDYKTDTKMIIMLFLILIFPIGWGSVGIIQNGFEPSVIILVLFFVIPLLIMIFFSYRERKKHLEERYKNQYIMKQGQVVEGTILKIWTETTRTGNDAGDGIIRINKARVMFEIDDHKNIIELDHLCFRPKKEYNGKKVKVYVLDSSNVYVDIINEVERSTS